MDKITLLEKLKELQDDKDAEQSHMNADDLLIEYINDSEITKEYEKIGKWYS